MNQVDWGDLALASSLVLIAALISVWLQLGLTKRIMWAALRTVVQLTAIGFVLKYLFAASHPLWMVVAVLVMTLAAGFSAEGRNRYRYDGIRWDALWAVALSCWLIAMIGLALILHVRPWYRPQYLIPILGMVLGNGLTAVALTLDRLTQSLANERGQIEMLLSLGATPWESFRSNAQQAVAAGMLPTLNSMAIVGLVSLPGMMTGQILAGGLPEQAVRYQIVIMFLNCAANALGCVFVAWLVYRRFYSCLGCFQYSKLQRR